jgi:Domain of unknown function (DUF3850)
MIHELKTWPEYFEAVKSRDKKFEVRVNDRDYKKNDELLLREFDPATQSYTGRTLVRRVCYVLKDCPFIPDTMVIMSIV